jgi:hypothetical protein
VIRPWVAWLILTLSFAVEAAVVCLLNGYEWYWGPPWAVAAAMSVVVLSVIKVVWK